MTTSFAPGMQSRVERILKATEIVWLSGSESSFCRNDLTHDRCTFQRVVSVHRVWDVGSLGKGPLLRDEGAHTATKPFGRCSGAGGGDALWWLM